MTELSFAKVYTRFALLLLENTWASLGKRRAQWAQASALTHVSRRSAHGAASSKEGEARMGVELQGVATVQMAREYICRTSEKHACRDTAAAAMLP